MKPNLERLRKVVAALENTPDERFDLVIWMRETDCGTVGCAVGHYVSQNPHCGLRFEQLSDGKIFKSTDVMDHFGLRWIEKEKLFDPGTYRDRSRQCVIERIRTFITIAENEALKTSGQSGE